MLSDEQIMSQLIDYAYDRMRKQNVYPFCAFIVKDGVIVSRGFNNVLNSWGDRTTHGEMVALRKALAAFNRPNNLDLSGYAVFSVCEPCLACFDTFLWANVGRIVYATGHVDFPDYFNDHKYSIDDYVKENPDKIEVVKHVLRNEAKVLFKEAKGKYGW